MPRHCDIYVGASEILDCPEEDRGIEGSSRCDFKVESSPRWRKPASGLRASAGMPCVEFGAIAQTRSFDAYAGRLLVEHTAFRHVFDIVKLHRERLNITEPPWHYRALHSLWIISLPLDVH